MIKSRFLPAAEAELLKEVTYYSIGRDGLGSRFVQEVENAVKMAAANPESGAPSFKGMRSRLVKGFPFRIVYKATASELIIVAVVHHRRKPGYWLDRVT